MPSDDIAISVRNLTKSYRLFGHPGDRIKQFFSLGLKQYHREFTALKDVSFDIKKGETVGIIGKNGSGKSTLLQLISGILKPTAGTLKVRGRVAALLELGAGFNLEFTGRENVFFHGSLMGLTQKQIEQSYENIVAFADIGEFIDEPVRTYSSGMFVRLAFSAAIHVEPDILIIDEVLAVGDASFQQKCFDQIYRLQSRGTSIIVVSHNPYQIERLCHRAAVMRQGLLSNLEPARDILTRYYEMTQEDMAKPQAVDTSFREGTQELHYEKVWIETVAEAKSDIALNNTPLRIVALINAIRPMNNVRFCFEIFSASNELVAVVASNGISDNLTLDGKHSISFTLDPCQFTSGWYYIDAIADNRNVRLDIWPRSVEFKVQLRDRLARNLSYDRGVFVCRGYWELS